MKIVFVHFGKVPKVVKLNVLRAARLFPNLDIVFVTDRQLEDFGVKHENFQLRVIAPEVQYEYVYRNSDLPKEFREQFWIHSLVRLFVVCDLAIECATPVWHIESDVLISKDFPFFALSHLNSVVAYPKIEGYLGVASTFFLSDTFAAEKFRLELFEAQRSNRSLTDMIFLGDYAQKFPTNFIELNSDPFKNSESLTDYLFDGAEYGQFLLGTDPRNQRGISQIYWTNPNSVLRIKEYNFIFNEFRDFIDVQTKDQNQKTRKLVSIHVHSKRQLIFRRFVSSIILKRAVKNVQFHTVKVFRFSIFVRLLMGFVFRKVKKIG